MARPLFITLDGIDGTGKSTQCQLLATWLSAQGREVVRCADPGGTPLGDQIRQLLLNSRAEMCPRAEALLFMASRAELVARIIQPALHAGKCVVSDRFVTANVVYQGHAGGLAPAELWAVGDFATGGLRPDLTLLLDVPVAVALARRQRPADRVEARGSAYMEHVRAGFLHEAAQHPDRIHVVDASGTIPEIHAAIVARVTSLLKDGV
jgi:dTMP kinase